MDIQLAAAGEIKNDELLGLLDKVMSEQVKVGGVDIKELARQVLSTTVFTMPLFKVNYEGIGQLNENHKVVARRA